MITKIPLEYEISLMIFYEKLKVKADFQFILLSKMWEGVTVKYRLALLEPMSFRI